MPITKEAIKLYARSVGLDQVGVAAAHPFPNAQAILEERAATGLSSRFEEADAARRCDPERWLPGAKTIVAAAISYLTATDANGEPADAEGPRGWISRYCHGQDYHHVLRERLARLAAYIETQAPGHSCLVAVDTAPPVDREVAVRAGLGFFGKSANLITPVFGTWVFLGEVITTLPLEPDLPGQGTCGACTRCIDLCPTGAIVAPGVIDSSRCISEVTQIRGYIPREFRRPMGLRLFGCDDCQDVCPYNRRRSLQAGDHPEFRPNPAIGQRPLLQQVLSMSRKQFREWFAPSAAGWRGKTVLQRNAVVALGNSGDERAVPLLIEALSNQRPVLRGHAAWALGQFAIPAARQALLAGATGEADPDVQGEIRLALAEQAALTRHLDRVSPANGKRAP